MVTKKRITPEIPASEIDIIASDHHRNGVAGAPFDVALFKYEGTRKLAILFPEPFYCAVLDIAELERGNLRSRWRGDAFEPSLRKLLQLTH